MITAIGGDVQRYFVAQTVGIRVEDGFTPEEFLERLPDVWDEDGYSAVGLAFPGGRGGKTPIAEVPEAAQRTVSGARATQRS